jgi:DNA (cytosine-5)-methyltransferase 1
MERMQIQQFNQKCSDESCYVVGDIRDKGVLKKIESILSEVKRGPGLDVLIATPPCQGISLTNHKKTPTEIVRNSLITESILLTKKYQPKYFIFENVLVFLESACSDSDGYDRTVNDVIDRHLLKNYHIEKYVFNLKHFSIPSSRTRTVVIGVRKDVEIHPLSIYPTPERVITLKEAIGSFKKLTKPKAFDAKDPLHFFRPYDERMLPWIENISEGQSAFDQDDANRIPNQVINGVRVVNQAKNGDKYKRQRWSDVGPCIHTRSDTFSSQNTIHPKDNRVFSIRELMVLMSIPENFSWFPSNFYPKTYDELRPYELNIRKAIGESFPTRYLQLASQNIINNVLFPYSEVEALNQFLKQNFSQRNFDISLASSAPKYIELYEIIQKCIFYNKLHRSNSEKLVITIGDSLKSPNTNILISSLNLVDRVASLTIGDMSIYNISDSSNYSLF